MNKTTQTRHNIMNKINTRVTIHVMYQIDYGLMCLCKVLNTVTDV